MRGSEHSLTVFLGDMGFNGPPNAVRPGSYQPPGRTIMGKISGHTAH